MTEIHVLRDVLIIFTISVLVVFVFQKFRFPAIAGFLVAGTLVGPHGLNLISDGEQVETLKSLCSSLFCVGPLCLKPPLQAGGKALRWKNQNPPSPLSNCL
jgi:NhaP-type Na+/H+ or K+/H+ antiporter